MIKKIDHINISVTDLEAATKFFVDFLGFEKIKGADLEGEWIEKVVGLSGVKARYVSLAIPGAGTSLELIHYFSPRGERDPKIDQANQIGFRHMAFEVDDIDAVYGRLIEAGVKMFSEVQQFRNKKLCYFLGPDGIILELAQYLID